MRHIAIAAGIGLVAGLACAGGLSAYPAAGQTGHGDFALLGVQSRATHDAGLTAVPPQQGVSRPTFSVLGPEWPGELEVHVTAPWPTRFRVSVAGQQLQEAGLPRSADADAAGYFNWGATLTASPVTFELRLLVPAALRNSPSTVTVELVNVSYVGTPPADPATSNPPLLVDLVRPAS
jgi:hypothetical protein